MSDTQQRNPHPQSQLDNASATELKPITALMRETTAKLCEVQVRFMVEDETPFTSLPYMPLFKTTVWATYNLGRLWTDLCKSKQLVDILNGKGASIVIPVDVFQVWTYGNRSTGSGFKFASSSSFGSSENGCVWNEGWLKELEKASFRSLGALLGLDSPGVDIVI